MSEIVQRDTPVLREKAKEVPLEEITSKRIVSVIKDMKKTLALQKDGVAIAAPQIGVPLRIFVVAGKAIDMQKGDYDENSPSKTPDQVFINPVIKKLSRQKKEMEEGCLSVRWLYGKVKRATKAEVEAYDESGKKFTRGGSDLMAQIFQHETDHLDGILFIDKATDVEELPPRETPREFK